MEIEGGSAAAKDEGQLVLGILDRIIDRRAGRIVEQNAVVGHLKEWQIRVGKRILLATEAVAKADVKSVIKISKRKIEASLGGKAAEHSHLSVHNGVDVLDAVRSSTRVLGRMAGIGLDDRDNVVKMQAVLAEFHKLGDRVHTRIHLTLGANVICISSAVITNLEVFSVLGDDYIVPREAIGEFVGVDKICMCRNSVSETLDVGEGLLHLLLTAERGLNGEKLRESAVVTAEIPSDKLKLTFLNPARLECIGNIAHARKIAGNVNGRLIFGSLMLDGRWALLPSHSNADKRRAAGIVDNRPLAAFVGKRNDLAAFKTKLALTSRVIADRTAAQRKDLDADVIVRQIPLAAEFRGKINAVNAALELRVYSEFIVSLKSDERVHIGRFDNVYRLNGLGIGKNRILAILEFDPDITAHRNISREKIKSLSTRRHRAKLGQNNEPFRALKLGERES